ncbi:VanZ family protein [Planctomycetota bacterium]
MERFSGQIWKMVSLKFTLPLLILVSIVTLLFGLWPLDFLPDNRVRWLVQRDGIQFYQQGLSTRRASGGVIYSSSPLEVRTSTHIFEPTTIEIYAESHEKRSGGLGHIVSFHDGYPLSPLVIGQWKTYLVIRSRDNQNNARDTYREIGLNHGLSTNEKKLITIASGAERTEIYVNGELARSYDVQSLIGVEHFCDYLNLGNSSIGHNAWVGNLYGLALYDTLLTSEQIRQHYKLCTDKSVDKPMTIESEPVILYTFAERAGAWVRNQMGDTNHLTIPSRFKALRRALVVRFWRDEDWDKEAVKDILVNTLGFVPFALCMLIFLTGNRRMSPGQAAFLTVLAGVTLSLIIETSQMGLPTRTPSLLDLLCNTAGAALGILVLRIVPLPQNKPKQGRRQKLHAV